MKTTRYYQSQLLYRRSYKPARKLKAAGQAKSLVLHPAPTVSELQTLGAKPGARVENLA